jgi:hypothetical protein
MVQEMSAQGAAAGAKLRRRARAAAFARRPAPPMQ